MLAPPPICPPRSPGGPMRAIGRARFVRERRAARRAQVERSNIGATSFGVAYRSLRSFVACVLLDTSRALNSGAPCRPSLSLACQREVPDFQFQRERLSLRAG